MAAPDLTATTVYYLLADVWMPPTDDSHWAMRVPGAIRVNGPEFAANLLDVAIWTLREEGLVEIEQLRPYEVEMAGGVLGGASFVRLTLVDPSATKAGLEGGLLDAAREQSEERGRVGRMIDRAVNRMSGEAKGGLRRVVGTLDIDGKAPWEKVAGYCFLELADAGLMKMEGRFFRKALLINAEAAVEELQPRLAKLRAGRRAYREREEELANGVFADCMQAVLWAHHTPD